MTLDINKILQEMLSGIYNTVSDNWDNVKTPAKQFLQNRKERIELLIHLRVNGEISEEKFQSRLEDERLILEAELNALAVISKALAQKAANAAIEVLEKAVKTAISAGI